MHPAGDSAGRYSCSDLTDTDRKRERVIPTPPLEVKTSKERKEKNSKELKGSVWIETGRNRDNTKEHHHKGNQEEVAVNNLHANQLHKGNKYPFQEKNLHQPQRSDVCIVHNLSEQHQQLQHDEQQHQCQY